jgi:hypothetical protein
LRALWRQQQQQQQQQQQRRPAARELARLRLVIRS